MCYNILMKTCTKCGETKEEELFSWKIKGKTRSSSCKSCHKDYRREHYLANSEKYKEKARDWEIKNGGKLFIRYRLTEDQYKDMLSKYDGLCWLCKIKPATCVDHDHGCCNSPTSCGKCVRGILCYGCNTGLGLLGDNIDSLNKAMVYLDSKE